MSKICLKLFSIDIYQIQNTIEEMKGRHFCIMCAIGVTHLKDTKNKCLQEAKKLYIDCAMSDGNIINGATIFMQIVIRS